MTVTRFAADLAPFRRASSEQRSLSGHHSRDANSRACRRRNLKESIQSSLQPDRRPHTDLAPDSVRESRQISTNAGHQIKPPYFRTPCLHAELIRIRGIELDLTNSVRPAFSLHVLTNVISDSPKDRECKNRTLSPLHLEKEVEFYKLQLQPGGELRSEPQFKGSREFLKVQKGNIRFEWVG